MSNAALIERIKPITYVVPAAQANVLMDAVEALAAADAEVERLRAENATEYLRGRRAQESAVQDADHSWRDRATSAEAERDELRDTAHELVIDRDSWRRVCGKMMAERDEARREVAALRSAAGRARGCINGLLRRTPVRDVAETLAELDAAIDAARGAK